MLKISSGTNPQTAGVEAWLLLCVFSWSVFTAHIYCQIKIVQKDNKWKINLTIIICVFSPSQLKTEFLPLLSVIFVSENSLVAAVRIKHFHCCTFHTYINSKCLNALSTSSGPWLLPHAVLLRRWWNADICVKARPPQAEHPEKHLRHGALQEHGQASHHRGPQHCPGHTAPEQHHVSHQSAAAA